MLRILYVFLQKPPILRVSSSGPLLPYLFFYWESKIAANWESKLFFTENFVVMS
jgi:hypothetical protein